MMLFNYANKFQIDGWHNDAKITHDPVNGGTWTGQIIGIIDYNLQNKQSVTINTDTGTIYDYFFVFNGAVGPNVQNELGYNMVNIIKTENTGIGYSQSYLEMLLDATPDYYEHNIPIFSGTDNSIMIKVNSIDTTVVPGYASVTIGFPGAPTMDPINPTIEPVNPPTLTPIDPLTLAPVKPLTSDPGKPPTPSSIILPIPATFNLPTYAPVNTLTLAPVNHPTSAHVST